jgi:N-acetylglucosaminyldiphosphoundecaprenol N-acetyl-beta-D-mannosaminyltransferase
VPLTGPPPKVNIVGTGVSAVTVAEASHLVLNPPEQGLVVAVANVHSVMSARRSEELARTLRRADLVTPDGMPLVWAQRALGIKATERVDGLRLFTSTVEAGLSAGTRHYFYGSSPETLQLIEARLRAASPGLQIAGMASPPFRELSPEEQAAYVAAIRESGPNVVWVGLGMPKQELWMDAVHDSLPGIALVGVGAVFDWVAGTVRKAPQWMQKSGLEWLFRFGQEPGRLWRRYAWNNPAFLALLSVQVLRHRMGNRSLARR